MEEASTLNSLTVSPSAPNWVGDYTENYMVARLGSSDGKDLDLLIEIKIARGDRIPRRR